MSATEPKDHTPKPALAELPAGSARRGKPTGARKWLYRFAAMTLIPVALVGILEVLLRLGGYGLDTSFFVDGSTIEQREVWIENKDLERWIFPPPLQGVTEPVPFVLPKNKPAGTYRIFVLGESAAMGYPEPAFSFARVLAAMLRARYPRTRFEVVNTSMAAINSQIVLPIARQCASQHPDLFIVHLGNNEVVGPFGAAGVLGPFSPSLGMIRANLFVKSTRTGQLLQRLMGSLGQARQGPRVWNGMATMAHSHVRADDDRLKRVNAHFRENLQDICRAGTDAGAAVVVCTIPVNLKDSAPFGSLHRRDLGDDELEAWNTVYQAGVRHEEKKQYADAVRCYKEAGSIDDQFADLAFRLARCYAALRKKGEAKESFARARDLDTLRFRTDTTINRTIREVLAGQVDQRVRLADAERAFEQSTPDGMAGEEFFLEHVHMNFKGNCLLARTVFDCITEMAPAALAESRDETSKALTDEQCAERLGYTEWNELKIAQQVVTMVTEGKPFVSQLNHLEYGKRWVAKWSKLNERRRLKGLDQSIAGIQKAVQEAPEDWMIRVALGEILSEVRPAMFDAATEQFVEALSQVRHNASIRYQIGQLCFQMHRLDEAEGQFREALRLDPDYMRANFGLAEVLAGRGERDEAVAIYRRQVRSGRNRLLALLTLGSYFQQIGELDEAREQFEQLLGASPDHLGALVSLGEIAAKQGRLDDSIEYYEAAMRIWPYWPGIQERLATVSKLRKTR